MNLLKLEYFIAVAKYKSFSKAAQKYHVAQPAISQQIKSLEKDLGFDLINRASRKFELTEAGHTLFQDGIRILNEFTYTIDKCRDIAQKFSGTLSVGITGWDETVYLVKLVEKFRERYPNISVNFKRVAFHSITEDLLNREYDCVLTLPYDFVDYEGIGYLNFARCKAYALVSKKNALSQKASLTREEIASQNCIFFNFEGKEKCKDHLLSFFNEKGILPSKIMNVDERDIMNIYIGLNDGIAIVPETWSEISPLGVVRLPIEGQPLYIDLSMVYKENIENLSLKYFLDVVGSESAGMDYKFML